MKNEDINDDFSFVELIKIIWKRKIIVIIATFLVGLFGALSIKYIYNASDEYYNSIINYSFPGIETGKYPDGTVFDYHDIISIKTLETIKNSDSDFDNIDLENMILSNSIEIIVAKNSSGEVIKNTFILNFSKSYFKNKTIARKFAVAVLTYPIERANKAIDNIGYDKYLIHFNSDNISYIEKINMLVNQYNYLYDGYQNIINERGDYLLSNGLNISYMLNELDNMMDALSVYSLYQVLEQKSFVNNPEKEKYFLEIQKEQYNITITNNQRIINDLREQIELIQAAGATGTTSNFEDYNKIIAQKIVENVDLEYKIKVINDQLYVINNSLTDATYIEKKNDFDENLNAAYNSLIDESNSYKSAYKEIYSANNNYHFEQSGIISKNGGISPFIGFILFASVGFLGSSLVVIIIDKNKKEDQK